MLEAKPIGSSFIFNRYFWNWHWFFSRKLLAKSPPSRGVLAANASANPLIHSYCLCSEKVRGTVVDLWTISSCSCGNQKSTSKALLQKNLPATWVTGDTTRWHMLPLCPMVVPAAADLLTDSWPCHIPILVPRCSYSSYTNCISRTPRVNFRGHAQLPSNVRRMHVSALICMWTRIASIYIYTYRSKTDNYSVKLLVVSHSSAVPQHMPFHHFLFVHGDTAHSFLVHTGAVPYTQGANQTQTVGQILLDLVCCVTNRLSGSLRLRPQRPLKSSSAIFYNTWQLHMHYLAPCGWLWTKKIRLYVFFFGCQCELPPCLRAYGM